MSGTLVNPNKTAERPQSVCLQIVMPMNGA